MYKEWLILLSITVGSAAFATEPTLAVVKQKHELAISQIVTAHLKLRVECEPANKIPRTEIEYWKDGPDYLRKFQTSGKAKGDGVCLGGRVRMYERSETPAEMPNIDMGRFGPSVGTIINDPQLLLLLILPGATEFVAPLGRVLSDPKFRVDQHTVEEAGAKSIRLILTANDRKREIWLSASNNFLVEKLVIWNGVAKFPDAESTALGFRSWGSEVVLPEKVVTKVFNPADGTLILTRTVTLTEASINKPIAREQLTFRFPANITVVDEYQKKIWKTDANGELGTEAKNAAGQVMTLEEGKLPLFDEDSNKSVTIEETKSWTRWLLPISAGVFSLGIILYLVHRYRGS